MKLSSTLTISIVITIIIVSLIWAVLYGPLFPFKMIDTEASRFNSPDGKVDVVYIQSSAGAMTSVRHFLYVVPKGQKPSKRDVAVFSGNRVWDLNITWESDRKLLVRTGQGTISHFQNCIYPFSGDKKYKVEIVLKH